MTPPDLTTRGGRIEYIRLSLAVRFGNVSLQRFGELVAAEESRMTGRTVAAYQPSTVSRWESGSEPSWDATLAIASLGGVPLTWLVSGQNSGGTVATATDPMVQWPGYLGARPTLPGDDYRVPDADMAEEQAPAEVRPQKKGRGRAS